MTKQRSDRGGLVRAGQLPLLKELADELEKTPAAPAPVKNERKALTPQILTDGELIRPEDIAYVHSIFLQCFMPVRHNANNRQLWQTDCGNASLAIHAGLLVKPDSPRTFKQCVVPAGPKARIITAYINDYAYRHKTPDIDLGESMRKFMDSAGVPVCGSNGKELQREMENVAAADIYLGVWHPGVSAHQKKAAVSEELSFWIDKNPNQQTLWQPRMKLSHGYYQSLMAGEHLAPIHWPAYMALQHNPRAMDIFALLCYRLRTIHPRKPVTIHADVLHGMFGRDIKQRKHFWPEFLKALAEALAQYRQAENSINVLEDKSAMRLGYAPPLIPHRKIGRIV